MKKFVAWSANKLLFLYLSNQKHNDFSYCVDSFTTEKSIRGLPITEPNALVVEDRNAVCVVIFAVSNTAMREIGSQLNKMGFTYGENYMYFSDFILNSFKQRFFDRLGWQPAQDLYQYALSFNLNSIRPIHTSVLGTLMFLECLKNTRHLDGDIAEIGAFECGNVLCAQNFISANECSGKTYYVFDSFEGFGDLSNNDPIEFRKKGDYTLETSLQRIHDSLRMFPQTRIIKGFVPETFKNLSNYVKFSLVFYDADLYQPALDTFAFFWDKIVDGGLLVIHDYEYEPNGFKGVSQATEEFFAGKDVCLHSFYENTMAIIRKPGKDTGADQ